jgi:hypothetical protein
MVSDELGKQLHDRATRGENLSSSEKDQLTAWYAAQDAAESMHLALPEDFAPGPDVQDQIDGIVQSLTLATQTIQTLERENAALRGEIATLRQQVAQHIALRPA